MTFFRALILIVGTFLWAIMALGQAPMRGLPPGAVVLETRNLSAVKHGPRAIALWMLNPKRNPDLYAADDIYTCPDYTRGSYYSGPGRVSLINTLTKQIINTIKIAGADDGAGDEVELPYAIRKGYYYRVATPTKKGIEARPNLLWLRDYNGDGRALEFALFEAEACMGLQTTLIGYSEQQDKVIQYPVEIDVSDGPRHSNRVSFWADYLFNKEPRWPGFWKYEIDYRGRAGTLDKWEVRYNAARERFEGKLTMVHDQEGPPELLFSGLSGIWRR